MDFDFEEVLECLGRVAQGLPPTSKESACIELAARALHFIHTRDELEEFRERLQVYDRPATEVIRVEQEFVSMDEARRWLESLAQPKVGVLVKVAGVTHVVARQRKDIWMLVRSLSPQELEDESAE
ncbi:hypothetical protein [Archangium sp.]|uniref:hypothetical protein n=1 Tax=Archangium sp. TaxID=1872627 RepID=UPI00286CAC97|nr:hypothetical protein [Archangium sp.]